MPEVLLIDVLPSSPPILLSINLSPHHSVLPPNHPYFLSSIYPSIYPMSPSIYPSQRIHSSIKTSIYPFILPSPSYPRSVLLPNHPFFHLSFYLSIHILIPIPVCHETLHPFIHASIHPCFDSSNPLPVLLYTSRSFYSSIRPFTVSSIRPSVTCSLANPFGSIKPDALSLNTRPMHNINPSTYRLQIKNHVLCCSINPPFQNKSLQSLVLQFKGAMVVKSGTHHT